MSLVSLIGGVLKSAGGTGTGPISSFVHQYRASSLVLSNGDPVTSVEDEMGAADAVGSGGPIYVANSGDPYITFDGVNDQVAIAPVAMNNFTYVMVADLRTYNDYDRMLEDGTLSLFWAGNALYAYIAGNGPTFSAPGPAPLGMSAILIERNGTAARFRLNGVEATGSYVTNPTTTSLVVGGGAGTHANMRLKELDIFNAALGSGAAFDTHAAYILSEYGLTL